MWQCAGGRTHDCKAQEARAKNRVVSVCCVSFLQGSRGDLLVSLCYNPTANTITVSIIKARNLKAMDIGGTSGTNAPSSHVFYTFSYRVAPSKQKGSAQVIFMAALIMIRGVLWRRGAFLSLQIPMLKCG